MKTLPSERLQSSPVRSALYRDTWPFKLVKCSGYFGHEAALVHLPSKSLLDNVSALSWVPHVGSSSCSRESQEKSSHAKGKWFNDFKERNFKQIYLTSYDSYVTG